MKVYNETPFAFASIMGKVAFPKDTITLIVKGTYDMTPDAAALRPAAEQPSPTGDLHYGDDPHATVRYESDFAWFKPRADILLVGHCHVPGGRVAGVCPVTFQAGPVSKTLVAFGDRTWQRNVLGQRRPSDPKPFTAMDLCYENSLGGLDHAPNPAGKGIRPDSSPDGRHRLPNLEMLTGDRIAPSKADGTPAGLGPLGRTWSQRMALAGSYGPRWQIERWPWLPEDFDWGYFNCAPQDQQVEGFLRGDESLFFQNLHPVHSRWRAALPGTRVRCFMAEKIDHKSRFHEIDMKLDTLWVDMDELRLVLVWRGLTTTGSADAQAIEDLLIVQEPVKESSRPVSEYEALLGKRKAAEAEAAASAPVGADEPKVQPSSTLPEETREAPDAPDATETALTAALEQAVAQVHRSLEHLNLDPHMSAAVMTEQDPQRLAELLMQVLPVDPLSAEKVQAHARQHLQEKLMQHRPEIEKILTDSGEDPAMFDRLDMDLLFRGGDPGTTGTAISAAARSAALCKQDLSGADFSGLALPRANFKSARLTGARFRGTRLAGADFSQTSLEGADFKGADLRGAKFIAADLNRSCFEGARMAGADLSEAVVTQAILKGADLTDARLLRVQLSQADLSRCVLKGADLENADLSGANLSEADLTKARLTFAILEEADLSRAVLRQVIAPSGDFSRGLLTQADFTEALLEEANFSDCRCDKAVFQAARLTRAGFEGAAGRRVNFMLAHLDDLRAGENARLPEAVLRQAAAKGANLAGADLAGADFFAADLIHCDFNGADLSGCDAGTADLRQSAFDQAVLRQAQFNAANLFQARLERADLRGASFRKCNLFQAELLNAIIDEHTTFAAANLIGTKLAGIKR